MAESYTVTTIPAEVPTTLTVSPPYLLKSHIHVYINDVEFVLISTDWNSSNILSTFRMGLVEGDVVRIARETPRGSLLVNFAAGADTSEENLDDANLQTLYVTQEAFDALSSTIQPDFFGNFDVLDKRLINVGDPIEAQDAVTKGYLDETWTDSMDASVAAAAISAVDAGASAAASDLSRVASEEAASAAHDSEVSAASSAALVEDAVSLIPAIAPGDADAFLTVLPDESGNEYVGGEDARTKLGLGSASIEDVVPVTKGGTGSTDAASARTSLGLGGVSIEDVLPLSKGGTGSTDAASARANLGLGTAAEQDAITAHQYVYVEQTGDDTTGDGSAGNPFKTVNRALDYIGSKVITAQSYMTVRVVGYLTDHPTITYERLNENIAAIRGEAPVGRFNANIQYISGAQPDWDIGFIEITAGLAAACSVGQYVLIDEVDDSTHGENIKVTGCWKVTEVGSNYIRCAIKDRTTTTGFSSTSSCRITPLPSGIIFASGVHGVKSVYPGVGIGMLADIALVAGDGDDPAASSTYGIYIPAGSSAWSYGYGVGVTGWNTGVLIAGGTLDANVDDLFVSNCQTGIYNDGGICRALSVRITGCASRGYRAQHGGVNTVHGSTKVIAGNGTGVYAYYSTRILAMNGTIAYNDDSFQPNANTEGNSDSLITA